MDPKRYPRRGKIRRKSRNRKNINTKNIHFIDTSLLLPRILLSYHVKTRPFSCASFSVIIDVHRPAIPILPPFHAFCISVVYTYYRKIHPFSAQHNYNFHTQSFSGSGILFSVFSRDRNGTRTCTPQRVRRSPPTRFHDNMDNTTGRVRPEGARGT